VALAFGSLILWRSIVPTSEPPSAAMETLDPAVARAITAARMEVRKAPRRAAAWGKLGMIFLAHDLRAEANRCFAEAERLDSHEPRWPYYQAVTLSAGHPAAAIPKMQRATELGGASPTNPRLRLAELFLDSGKLEQAAECYRVVVHAEPRNTVAALGLARIFFAQDKLDDALAHARPAAEDVHTAKASRQLLAQIAERRGNREEAAAELRRASALPDDAPWPDPFAEEVARLATGRQARISRADQLLGANRPAEAAVLLRQITDEYPESDWAWMLLGRALLMSRNVAGAERALQHAERLAPNTVGTQYHLGVVALVKKDYENAAEHFEKAVQLQPDFAAAHCNLGRCLMQRGNRLLAEAQFRAAVRSQPDYAEAHTELAELLASDGRKGEAAEHLRHALALRPSDPRASKLLEQVGQP